MTSIRRTLPALLALLLPATASADHDGVFSRPGFYLGAGLRGAEYTEIEDDLEDAIGAEIEAEKPLGFDIVAGYRVLPRLALEGEFEWLPKADVDVSGVGTLAEVETWAATANAKLFLFTGRLQPYALAGMGVMYGEVSDPTGLGVTERDHDFTARFGAGLDFYLTPHVAVTGGADYLIPTGDMDGFDAITFGGGLLIRF
jgi:opacity protein-like surface antigen